MTPEPRIPDPRQAAEAFLEERFPDALAAILSGSASRGEATATSDLDLVLLAEGAEAPYVEAFRAYGWPVEVVVATPTTYAELFRLDAERREPVFIAMCAEGIVLRERDGLARRMKREADDLLRSGPAPLSDEELATLRFVVTNLLLDLEGSTTPEEGVFAVTALVPALADLTCGVHRQWRGEGKWIPKALRAFAPDLAERLGTALATFHRERDERPLIRFADEQLGKAGGRLLEGFALGKSESTTSAED